MRNSLRVIAGAVLLSVSAAVLAFNGKPAIDRDTVVFAIGRDIAMLDAQVDNTGNSDRYHWQMYDGLYTFDKKGHLTPQIATGVKVSPDGLEYRFTMRTGVKCHNGAVLTSKDAKFAFDRILDPAVKSTRRPYFADFIESVSTPDAHTVVVKLKKLDVVFLNKVAAFVPLIPMEYTQRLGSPEAFARAPVGCGPYKLVEHKIGQSVELARFDDYWGKKPGIKRLIFKFIPDASSRVNALLAGEVDMADGIAPNDIARLKQSEGLDIISVPMGSPLHVRLYANTPGTPLANPKVRLALNYAIDVDAIIKNVMHGVGKPLSTFISSYYPIGVDPTLKPYGYDPARAKKLLAEAGYPNGFDTELLSPTSYPKDVTEAVAAYWSAIGVRAKVKLLDYPAWNRLNNTHKSGPMTVMQYSNALYDPITPIAGTASKEGTWSDYYNPEVQALIDKSASVADPAERDHLFREIAKKLRDDGHAVLISELFSVFAKDPSIVWEPQFGYSFYDLRTLARK
ncbi:MAG TPA: ABC transporter substrate-binding protein [Burkholderiales bacterium]|nr:ABC transporter substrate-binding protein [Burkholderiales bacterium]